MKYDVIMKSITSGLTGDKETDLSYIKDQMEKYKDHNWQLKSYVLVEE
ncbi:MAG: hypothetical protein RR869_09705 [Lachnospiraceae bacterium]